MNWPVFSAVLTLGLAAGFAPGPTQTLVITQTLRYGLWEGTKVSIAPLLTDFPIMCAALVAMNQLERVPVAFGAISLAGALFLLYLSGEIFFSKATPTNADAASANSLFRGVITNALNPGPYLFWGTVGAPMLIKSWREDPSSGLMSAALFLALIVGGKFAVALVANFAAQFFRGQGYLWLLRALAAVMLFFSLYYFKDAGVRFGII